MHNNQPAKLAELAYVCKYCRKGFDDGRRLGGHIRQAHPAQGSVSSERVDTVLPFVAERELAGRVLEMWERGEHPKDIVMSLKVHPRFVREVVQDYDKLLNEWSKRFEAIPDSSWTEGKVLRHLTPSPATSFSWRDSFNTSRHGEKFGSKAEGQSGTQHKLMSGNPIEVEVEW